MIKVIEHYVAYNIKQIRLGITATPPSSESAAWNKKTGISFMRISGYNK